ncbi:hypothetical protein NKR23_g6551 [Pleurostoma richardsiae]|uniref:Uncharacterized protein n=1 Tax=Pleurostoma richardsiae TaxID=41990 RepID=A0AA38VS97_9PEZI|nr:hypothetical protein NKR23_g6551 [Pleurostoma richardsiae]
MDRHDYHISYKPSTGEGLAPVVNAMKRASDMDGQHQAAPATQQAATTSSTTASRARPQQHVPASSGSSRRPAPTSIALPAPVAFPGGLPTDNPFSHAWRQPAPHAPPQLPRSFDMRAPLPQGRSEQMRHMAPPEDASRFTREWFSWVDRHEAQMEGSSRSAPPERVPEAPPRTTIGGESKAGEGREHSSDESSEPTTTGRRLVTVNTTELTIGPRSMLPK